MASRKPEPDLLVRPERARLDVLEENERTLKRLLVDAEPQHVSQIARELRATVRELAELRLALGNVEVSLSDELASKRARRVSAVDSAPAARRSQPGRRDGRNRTG